MLLFMVFYGSVFVKTNISVQFSRGMGAILALPTLNTWHSSSLQQALWGIFTSQRRTQHILWAGHYLAPEHQKKPRLRGENQWAGNCSPPRGCERAQQERPGTRNKSGTPGSSSGGRCRGAAWGWQGTWMQLLFTIKWTRYFVTVSDWQLGEGGWKGR